MAGKILQLSYVPNVSNLTANVFPRNGGAALNVSGALTFFESNQTPGLYLATMNDAAVGQVRVNIYRGSAFVAQYQTVLLEVATTFDLGDVVVIAGFTDGALLAMRTSLTGVVLTRRGPVFSDGGQLSITLVCGDDYLLADGRQIDLDLDGTSLPDLTGASVSLRLASGVKVTVAGSVVVATGSTRTVRFQPTATMTSTLTAGENGVFAVKIQTASGHVLSPNEARGVLTVLSRVVI